MERTGVDSRPAILGFVVATLLKPSGAVYARLELPSPLPPTLTHDGVEWRRSHTPVSGAAYERVRPPV